MKDDNEFSLSMASYDYGQSERQRRESWVGQDIVHLIVRVLTGQWSSHPQVACVFLAVFVLAPALLLMFTGVMKYVCVLI